MCIYFCNGSQTLQIDPFVGAHSPPCKHRRFLAPPIAPPWNSLLILTSCSIHPYTPTSLVQGQFTLFFRVTKCPQHSIMPLPSLLHTKMSGRATRYTSYLLPPLPPLSLSSSGIGSLSPYMNLMKAPFSSFQSAALHYEATMFVRRQNLFPLWHKLR